MLCSLVWIHAPIITFKKMKARGCFGRSSDGEDQEEESGEKDIEKGFAEDKTDNVPQSRQPEQATQP
jgi:hypothetical protein